MNVAVPMLTALPKVTSGDGPQGTRERLKPGVPILNSFGWSRVYIWVLHMYVFVRKLSHMLRLPPGVTHIHGSTVLISTFSLLSLRILVVGKVRDVHSIIPVYR